MLAPLETNGGGLAKDMTLRDWFAGQALVGLLASTNYDANPHGFTGDAALVSYRIANHMLIERERGE